MDEPSLDEVDRGILHRLQRDCRNVTAGDIAEEVGVSASTVRNRISRLEERGVITGYQPVLDYEAADFPLRLLLVCTAQPDEREFLGERVQDIHGVVGVRELMTAKQNLHVEVVGTGTREISTITDAIHDLGLVVERSDLLKNEYRLPFDHFDVEVE